MQPKHELLYRMVTGDKNAPRFPQMAVRWRTPPTDIAAFVTEASSSKLSAELFHFGQQPRALDAELHLLRPGRYRVELQIEGQSRELPAVTINRGKLAQLPLELPPHKLCILQITPTTSQP